MEQEMIQVRVDSKLKNDAIDILDQIGLDMPNAIRMFLKRIVAERGLPFDAKFPEVIEAVKNTEENNRKKEIGEKRKRMVIYYPASPHLDIDYIEYIEALKLVPQGMLTRYDDVLEYLARKHNINRVELIGPRPIIQGFRKEYPYWRVVSARGFLQEDRFLCSISEQKELLEQEGHKIISGGAGGKSLRVENYKDFLFDFSKIE